MFALFQTKSIISSLISKSVSPTNLPPLADDLREQLKTFYQQEVVSYSSEILVLFGTLNAMSP